jgi:hypothetical protein
MADMIWSWPCQDDACFGGYFRVLLAFLDFFFSFFFLFFLKKKIGRSFLKYCNPFIYLPASAAPSLEEMTSIIM